MLNIIKADLFRVFKGKGIYACLLMVIVLCSASIYLRSPGHIGVSNSITANPAATDVIDSASPEEVREIGEKNEMLLDEGMMKVNGNLYYPIIFVIFAVICVDLSNHTAKNVISTEVSRTKYYLAKLLLTWGLGMLLIVLSTYFGYFGNILVNNPTKVSSIIDITIIMIRQLPIFCGIMSVLVMIATIVHKSSRYNAIAITLVALIQMILMLLITVLNIDGGVIMQFEFETIIRSLAVAGSISIRTLMVGVFMGLGLIVGSTAIGIYYFNRCNIK